MFVFYLGLPHVYSSVTIHTSLSSEGICHMDLWSKLRHLFQHTTSLLGKVKGWRKANHLIIDHKSH